MWIILGVLLSFSVQALEAYEKINNVKILRVLDANIVMLNRGIEDGILRNSHAKLSNDIDGYSSRAICLKTSADVSYWKIYRIPNAEAFSLDYTYTLTGMADKEIPEPEINLRDANQKIPDYKENKDPGLNPFTIKRDLPERLTERDLIKAAGPEQRKLFVEQTLNRDQLQRDLKDYRISLYASPFMKQSINEGESLRYGFRGGNVASKYRLLTHFEQQQTKLKDPLSKESVATKSSTGQAQFMIHRLTPSVSSLSLINYSAQSFSSLGTPKSHWQVGVIGFTLHMYESTTWEYIDLSYIPLYDIRTTDAVKDGTVTNDRTSGLRHGFRFAVRTKINERVAFENLLWVRPFQDLASGGLEGDNLNLSNDLKLIFNVTENLFIDYNLVYQKDKIWKTLNNLPESNTINSLNVRYDFNL